MLVLNVSVGPDNAPICACPNCHQFSVDSGIVKQVLLDCHSTLFLVKFCLGLTASKSDIQIGNLLVENTATKC